MKSIEITDKPRREQATRTTIQTLTRQAQLVCDSTDSLTDGNNYLNNVFSKNNYNADFIRRNTYKPAEHNEKNANPTPVTKATIPYIKGSHSVLRPSHGYYNLTIFVLLTNPYDFATATNQIHGPVQNVRTVSKDDGPYETYGPLTVNNGL